MTSRRHRQQVSTFHNKKNTNYIHLSLVFKTIFIEFTFNYAIINQNALIMPGTLIQRLKTIDLLIQKKNTGNAAVLAQKLKVSERTIKEFISVMKELGAPIYYNRKACSYCYAKNGRFVIHFEAF